MGSVRTDPSPTPARYVAPDLSWFEAPHPGAFADDVTVGGICHRRLDPAYYAWLRGKMVLAKKALDAGRLSRAAFDGLRHAFEDLHGWAVEHLGAAALAKAVKSHDDRRYAPPRPDDDLAPRMAAGWPHASRFLFPRTGAWPFVEPVARDAVAKVDAVRDEALALGWSDAALYQNRGHLAFPVGGEWGLVCFLTDGATIGAVTREAIAIHRPRGAATCFPNRVVAQPWRSPTVNAPADEAAAPVAAGARR